MLIRRVGLAACALVLLAVAAVSAQQVVVTGTVVRIDQPAGVVVLDNGQMYRATPQTVFLVNNQPMTFGTIQPGIPVIVQYGEPVVYREGRYVVMTQAAPSSGVFEVSGVVRYVGSHEPGRASLTLDDGRHIWLDQNTLVLANGAPVMVSTLRPGTFVVIRSTKPLAYRNNTYYTTASAPVVVAPVVATPVVTQPALTMVSGTIVRLDQPNTIVLSDGRMIPATAQTVVMVDNRAVPLTTLRPGYQVVIYPNGQTGAVINDPYAFAGPRYPEMGLREKEMERNAP